jgi:ribulose-5-phosphate 4-epimerase/fuculose-1-phosphate aldolase
MPHDHDHPHDHTHDHAHAHDHQEVARLEEDLKIASKILEWESGDIFGHVGVRLPGGEGIACKLFRPIGEDDQDWLVHFDFAGRKLAGLGTPPFEAPIYTEILKRRPDVKAIVHTHSPAAVALSLVDTEITTVHMQSAKFAEGVPIYPRAIHIKDEEEGADLAQALAAGNALVIKGHGVVTAGKSIDEACMLAMYLERTAKIQGLANTLGFDGPTPELVKEIVGSRDILMRNIAAAGGREATGGYSNEWRYYRSKIRRGETWTRGWS